MHFCLHDPLLSYDAGRVGNPCCAGICPVIIAHLGFLSGKPAAH